MKTNKKGISLIVLVITIIVMIILATAIILSLSGSDIRGKAEEAVSSTDIASAKELVAVAQSEWELNYDELTKEYDDFGEYATKKLEKTGIDYVSVSKEGAVNTIYTDSKGKTAIIPEGFGVSTVASEQTIDDGLVIVDKDGNEFVWVPVDDMSKFARTTKYKASESITDPGTNYTEPFSKIVNGITLSEINDLTGEWKEYALMRASVESNKGFYIGRYEVGTNIERTNTSIGTTEVVVQKNKPVYKWVAWGPSMTETKGDVVWNDKNQGKGAVELSRQMYKTSKSVVSTLCYGVQWDAALQFIATKDADYLNVNYEPMEEGSSTTGHNVANNIYDMGGNAWEWTMEAYDIGSRVVRGCRGGLTPQYKPSSRDYTLARRPDYSNNGFRITLYIK